MDIENLKWQELILSSEEFKSLEELLEAPPQPPTEYSIRALEEYREMIRNGTLTVVD